MSTRVVSAPRGRILLLTLESDDGLPRLERRVLADLASQIERLAAAEFDGCVITGGEAAFAVGAEISELARLTAAEAYEFSRVGQSIFRRVEQSPKPVIAAIRGYCMGGGLDLALACQARVASPDAAFAHPGGSLGILTGWGGTQRLTRLIGRGRAMEMFTTGRKLDASEALECGLISKILPASEILSAAAELSGRTGRISRRAPARGSLWL
ncbi:MAG TPA: enoyl-CoA hydratase/isomerase family protein [Candidatus Acidoferrum sp.]|nr:enoyl-CoA hydratase/isomerase family protein [Candidatus Acidoferrum sp.]